MKAGQSHLVAVAGVASLEGDKVEALLIVELFVAQGGPDDLARRLGGLQVVAQSRRRAVALACAGGVSQHEDALACLGVLLHQARDGGAGRL